MNERRKYYGARQKIIVPGRSGRFRVRQGTERLDPRSRCAAQEARTLAKQQQAAERPRAQRSSRCRESIPLPNSGGHSAHDRTTTFAPRGAGMIAAQFSRRSLSRSSLHVAIRARSANLGQLAGSATPIHLRYFEREGAGLEGPATRAGRLRHDGHEHHQVMGCVSAEYGPKSALPWGTLGRAHSNFPLISR